MKKTIHPTRLGHYIECIVVLADKIIVKVIMKYNYGMEIINHGSMVGLLEN